MKVKVWVYISNLGDGSAAANFFSTEAEAEAYAEQDNERFCEDIYCKTLEFDSKGKLLNPSTRTGIEEYDDL